MRLSSFLTHKEDDEEEVIESLLRLSLPCTFSIWWKVWSLRVKFDIRSYMQRYIVNINILGQDKRNAFDVEQVFVQPSAGNGQFVVDEETRERSQKSQDTAKKDAGFNASQIEQEEEEAEEIRK